jgi:GGDEF domain-containing protein
MSLPDFEARFEVEVQRAHRYGRALSLAVIAFDGLEGADHQRRPTAPEALLATCGEAIAGAVRSSDVASRTGRVEFAILFPETPAKQASWATTRVVDALGDVAPELIRGVAAAAAVAGLAPNESPEALLARARAARGAGPPRDRRVSLAPPSDLSEPAPEWSRP